MKATDVVIIGTGGFGREVHQIVEDLTDSRGDLNFLGFLDSNPELKGTRVHEHPVLGGLEWLQSHPAVGYLIGIGNPAARFRVAKQLDVRQATSLVHPMAWLGNRVEVGPGTIICAGALVTTDIKIGTHVVLNLDCTVGHDATIGDFVTAAPSVNISGEVVIGNGVELGTGSTISNDLRIGEWSIVGAGTVVVRDIPSNVTAVGAPAKVIKERDSGWHRVQS